MLRLVVGADDARRKQDHEKERDEHGAQREPRLLALLVLCGGDLCVVRRTASSAIAVL
jgi:hypothetical protein